MGILSILWKMLKFFKFWKDGGISYLNLSSIEYPQLLQGKTAIVTGGSSGIGLAIAKKFLAMGAEVLITGRDLIKLEKVERDINNPKLHIMQWDIKEFSKINENIEIAKKILNGSIDILVNNAAFIQHKNISIESFDANIDTNLKAVYLLSLEIVKHMKSIGGGKIVNISSLSSFENEINPYHISKSALNTFTKGLAKEVISSNIIVNSVAPGYCASSINYVDVEKNAYCERSKNKRIIIPEEVAELVAFLSSDASNGIVGQIIVCDGGALL